ncbi:hypothetical protein DK37_02960 [Halomonas sp. SUBG004]|nr:hypothetical protein DK37_02960 [Halomonas sp. SUBG004]
MTQFRGFIHHCEQEALHLSGAIQPHGVLLITDVDGTVSHVSANAETLLRDVEPQVALGKPLPAFLDGIVKNAPQPRSWRAACGSMRNAPGKSSMS